MEKIDLVAAGIPVWLLDRTSDSQSDRHGFWISFEEPEILVPTAFMGPFVDREDAIAASERVAHLFVLDHATDHLFSFSQDHTL